MKFEVTIIGCGSAIPTVSRKGSSQLVNHREKYFLLDCTEGTQYVLKELKISLQRIDHVFITHAHADHFLGLPGLLSTMSLLGRTKEINIYAPEEIETFIHTFLTCTRASLSFKVNFKKLNFNSPETIFENKELTIESVPLLHSTNCCGFIFREKKKPRPMIASKISEYIIPHYLISGIKEGDDLILPDGKVIPNHKLTEEPQKSFSYAYLTDTSYHEEIVPQIQGIDVLYHEATFTDELKTRAKQTKHSTAKDAAKIASLAQVDQLYIGHFSARYRSLDVFMEECQSIFKNSHLTFDRQTIKIY
jgi:ribonuclease Z